MASDRLVTAGHVLKAVMEIDRRGSRRVLSEWERLEPDLTEFILESLTALHHKLGDAGLSGVEVRRLYRQAETIVLVSITALRSAHHELWKDDPDPPTGDPTEPPTSTDPVA